MNSASLTWSVGEPIYYPRPLSALRSHAVKDPSIVHFEGRWHLFTTVRDRRQNLPYLEYCSFSDWADADQAPRKRLELHNHLYCAPQIFFYRPHNLWYLVYQAVYTLDGRKHLQAVYSCNKDIHNSEGWSAPRPFFETRPNVERWIDFWVMGDDKLMYLFYTGCGGFMGMSSCTYQDFPHGFGPCKTVIEAQGDGWKLFEASHLYKIKQSPWYIAVIEGLSDRRFFQLYASKDLHSSDWIPLAITPENAFAHESNVYQALPWTNHISHGEFLRAGYDERLEINDTQIKMLIQGVDNNGYWQGYSGIPWKLGIMSAEPEQSLTAFIEERVAALSQVLI